MAAGLIRRIFGPTPDPATLGWWRWDKSSRALVHSISGEVVRYCGEADDLVDGGSRQPWYRFEFQSGTIRYPLLVQRVIRQSYIEKGAPHSHFAETEDAEGIRFAWRLDHNRSARLWREQSGAETEFPAYGLWRKVDCAASDALTCFPELRAFEFRTERKQLGELYATGGWQNGEWCPTLTRNWIIHPFEMEAETVPEEEFRALDLDASAPIWEARYREDPDDGTEPIRAPQFGYLARLDERGYLYMGTLESDMREAWIKTAKLRYLDSEIGTQIARVHGKIPELSDQDITDWNFSVLYQRGTTLDNHPLGFVPSEKSVFVRPTFALWQRFEEAITQSILRSRGFGPEAENESACLAERGIATFHQFGFFQGRWGIGDYRINASGITDRYGRTGPDFDL